MQSCQAFQECLFLEPIPGGNDLHGIFRIEHWSLSLVYKLFAYSFSELRIFLQNILLERLCGVVGSKRGRTIVDLG